MTSEETRRMTRRALTALGAVLVALIATAGVGAATASAKAEIKNFELTRSTAQAGGHPEVYIQMKMSSKETEFQESQGNPAYEVDPCFCADPKQFTVHFPTGFIGNPHAIPQCTLAQLGLEKCPPDSQVGLASALFGTQFIYNMEPRPGEPGLLVSEIPLLKSPIFTILRSRTNSDYGLDATTPDIFHLIGLQELSFRIWGVPTDPANNRYRAPLNEEGGCFNNYPEPCFTTPVPATAPPAPYLQNPTSCEGPLSSGLDVTYYNREQVHADFGWSPTTGCDLLGFDPSLIAEPTTTAADSPAGLDLIARVPQTQSATVPSASELRTFRLRLPKGMSINPTAADGKTACTEGESAIGTLEPATCPESSKIGTTSIDSSALPGPISGAVYIGEPLPGERYRVILAADGYETPVKLAGTVHLNQSTGQVEIVFDNLPQSPLQEFTVHIFGAERGLLSTPAHCGEYDIESEFVPWAGELGAQDSSTSFSIDSGPNGTPCPGSSRPLAPTLVAGSPDNTAGAYSPFAVKLDRKDGDQNLTGLNVVTPPGFLASLRGIPYCPESAIAKLSDPTYSGRSEQASSACPSASQVGTTVTALGSGSRPLNTPGKVYLAGPYKGAPVSLLIVVPAVSGPYDLGNVAVRVATYVDPTTSQVTTVSDPLPQMIEGIPLRARSLFVNLNRPNFTLNPTNCDPFSVDTTVFGDEGGQAEPHAYYQVANCGALDYHPELHIHLSGGLNRLGHPAIHATFSTEPGEANSRRITVTLPNGELLDNSHIGNVCSRADYAAETCPEGSLLGNATVWTPLLDQPLTGAVYLRSEPAHRLPDLAIDLKGQVNFELAGQVSGRDARLGTSFETVPDVPVSKFTLNLEGGAKGLLQNSESLCGRTVRATVGMLGQNGTMRRSRPKLSYACASARHKRHRRHHRAGKAG